MAVLFGLIYWASTAALGNRIDEDLAIVRDRLIAEAGTAKRDVAVSVADALRQSHGDFRYLVLDAGGTTLAGNLPATVDWHAGNQEIELPVDDNPDRERRHPFRSLGYPLDGGGLLLVAQDVNALDELRELIVRAFGWGAAATLLLAAIGGGIMVWRVAHRIEVINRASERIMAGDLSERLPVGRSAGRADEFDRLSINLNIMLDRIEDLVGGLRQVSTDIAHDLRTPLGHLRRHLERVRADASGQISGHISAIDDAIDEADDLLATFAALLRIAQIEAGAARRVFGPVDLAAIVASVVEVYRPSAEEKRQDLAATVIEAPVSEARVLEAPVLVTGDRALLTQMIANLAENAIRHTPEGSLIRLDLEPASERRGPRLTISDDGPGIPCVEREKVFRRFYRLDASRGTPGNGLGLSLVGAVAELHGVAVELADNTPRGLKVCVAFPPFRDSALSLVAVENASA